MDMGTACGDSDQIKSIIKYYHIIEIKVSDYLSRLFPLDLLLT